MWQMCALLIVSIVKILKTWFVSAIFQDLNNGVINACFMLLFRDLIRLFACYNDGVINLLEKYFEMQKKQARDALDLYKKFLIRMDRVAEFLKVAEVWSVSDQLWHISLLFKQYLLIIIIYFCCRNLVLIRLKYQTLQE